MGKPNYNSALEIVSVNAVNQLKFFQALFNALNPCCLRV
jgi:hypothetical protein